MLAKLGSFVFAEVQLPIYVRVNTLLATVKEVLKHFRDRGFDLVKMPEGAPYDA